MDTETRSKVEETVLEILKSSNMDEMTEFKIRKSASEKLEMDLNEPTRKKFVREIVESYIMEQQSKASEEQEQEDEEEEEEEEDNNEKKDGKEYDDQGGLIICRLTKTRRVTISEFKGKKLVSMREYYNKDGKELPSAKGISLNAEQWAKFKKNIPAIEQAIKKMEAR
ncbi:hypothetical protein CASFOL_020312 [Castilleja foliolosa]|uniref:DEK-C domain-containing protein n=1 Tax=Castilleja foliolosa TaxID=1961234 RepID=A0ABD3D0H3_9LAMI